MPEKFIIKRAWKDTLIRVRMDTEGVEIEAPIDAFERRLEEQLLENLPSLATSFRASTINEKVRQAFRDAFTITTREMKEETVKATR
jgi:predicted metal-dependent hydrolase